MVTGGTDGAEGAAGGASGREIGDHVASAKEGALFRPLLEKQQQRTGSERGG